MVLTVRKAKRMGPSTHFRHSSTGLEESSSLEKNLQTKKLKLDFWLRHWLLCHEVSAAILETRGARQAGGRQNKSCHHPASVTAKNKNCCSSPCHPEQAGEEWEPSPFTKYVSQLGKGEVGKPTGRGSPHCCSPPTHTLHDHGRQAGAAGKQGS